MSTTLGIVEVPGLDSAESATCSTPFSIAEHRLGKHSLLNWIVRRVTDALLLDRVAIVAEEEQRELIVRLAPPDVEAFFGPQPDALGRAAAAVKYFEADQVVRVPIRCPFVDPELLDRLVCIAGRHSSFDYIGYFRSNGRPAVQSRVGVCGEWCRAAAIERADKTAKSPADRANSLRFISNHPELFAQRFVPLPPQLDRADLRLAMETAEDWDNAELIFDALGPERLDWRRIIELIDDQPRLRERMASLNEAESEALASS